MRESDIDWVIYHIIAASDDGCTRCRISNESVYDDPVIDSSLQRLVSFCLIREQEQVYRAVSIEEYILQSQLRYCERSQIILENGVIKVKKPDE
ncbi:MAG: hypothetical protein JXA44_07305 [Methanospirillaceae archaeon]|nr:hypothetical protein [Methanospirillaceae archaeon]